MSTHTHTHIHVYVTSQQYAETYLEYVYYYRRVNTHTYIHILTHKYFSFVSHICSDIHGYKLHLFWFKSSTDFGIKRSLVWTVLHLTERYRFPDGRSSYCFPRMWLSSLAIFLAFCATRHSYNWFTLLPFTDYLSTHIHNSVQNSLAFHTQSTVPAHKKMSKQTRKQW